ncbi:substrate-binding domain-containing protein [Dyella sedimenti]|uniref:substrate-binding domain-containing protein n=1 Tax=Dyella sedimenti TaxID=2919947 RepID=UPI001FAA33AA|nr:substrate-binding domain-containing protein [Dyella sedimenti]
MKTLAGALVLGMAAVASAHATIVGGGATLPAIGYTFDDVSHRLLTPQPGSLLGEYTTAGNPAASYCQTGSGAGKNILAGGLIGSPAVNYNVQNTCPDNPTPTGFGAGQVGRSDLAQPNFIGADSPLALSDYNNYVANTSVHSGSFPVQFPSVGGAIAIAFNKNDVNGQQITSLDLDDNTICQIFSGQITDWSQVSSNATGPISVVYRSDGSGTTFGFSNHLSQVCGGTPTQHFVTDQAFSTVAGEFFANAVLPSTWNPQSGNPNVAGTIAATEGTIGYVEAANTLPPGAVYATVNGLDPFNDFGNSPLDVSASVLYNKVINGAESGTGRPHVDDLSTLVSGAPTSQCIALVDPDSYANPAGYPIVAVSYFLANSAHNGADTTAVQNLMWAPYDSNIIPNVFAIGGGTGLSFLNAGLTQGAVQGCIASM